MLPFRHRQARCLALRRVTRGAQRAYRRSRLHRCRLRTRAGSCTQCEGRCRASSVGARHVVARQPGWLWQGRPALTGPSTRTPKVVPRPCRAVHWSPVTSDVIGQRHEKRSAGARARSWVGFWSAVAPERLAPRPCRCRRYVRGARAVFERTLWRWPAETLRFGALVGARDCARTAALLWGAIPSVRAGGGSTWQRSGEAQVPPRTCRHGGGKLPVCDQRGFGVSRGGFR